MRVRAEMDEGLRGLVQKPMKVWSQEERNLFIQRVNEINAQGGVAILPLDRCSYCGDELNENVLSVNRLDERQTGLVMPLCEECAFATRLTMTLSKVQVAG